ncbi:amino acid transporter [Ceraceosorus guamensis]|uniref:Amino acid transporter n=1 Tax=Ceraceosorus guamensis TaxID=1522189 RepID=A0A316W4U8_9BASI|nr:amino acid transporter [Ceraceosorus guamensis]PWN44752.1 amino acid transporter [Ceraceosorus guamensis]
MADAVTRAESVASKPSEEKVPYDVSVKESVSDRDAAAAQSEENGDLHRALKPRQVSMIAIGGAIGTGLIIGTGSALGQGGPAGVLIGYVVMGLCCFATLCALAEMSAYIPHKRGFPGHATRFVSPEFGFATGYNYLFKYLIIFPTQLSAAALLITFWTPLNPAVIISVYLVVCVFLNYAGVAWFGEIEFWLSFIKIIVLTGLILLALILDLGGGPTGDFIGGRNWRDGRAFREYKAEGALGRFLGVWSCMTTGLFAFMGSELIGVCVGETANPRKALPSAIKKTFYRILFFYWIGTTMIGLIVPSDDPRLLGKGVTKGTAAASPFVIAVVDAQIKALPSLVNACLLIFVLSACNSDLYIAARTLYAIAEDGNAPRIFLKCNKRGVPYMALGFSSIIGAIAYMSVNTGGNTAFGYLKDTVTICGGVAWCNILYSHIAFMRGLKAQGISRDILPYRAPFAPYTSWAALIWVSIVLFFKGFAAFIGKFEYKTFITHYIALPFFFVLWFGYKFVCKTKVVKPQQIDFAAAQSYDHLDEKEDEEIGNLTMKQKTIKFFKEW